MKGITVISGPDRERTITSTSDGYPVSYQPDRETKKLFSLIIHPS